MNTAQKIAGLLGDDGQRWETVDGESLDQLAQARGADVDQDWGRGATRYTFADGSVLTESGGCWDFGFVGCFCWQGAGHDSDNCEADAEAMAARNDGVRVYVR